MNKKELKQKISGFPDTPGVYLMKDGKDRVIYVGKAKSLKKRVSSYFTKNHSSERLQIGFMMSEVSDVDFLATGSEVEAFLLEARLIKDIKPKYNVDLKDDKTYPHLEIRSGEDFPSLCFTRDISEGSSIFFGPFVSAESLRDAIGIMQEIFRFRTCNKTISADDKKRRFNKPCLLYHILRCSAPCCDFISKEDYSLTIKDVLKFLEGNRDGLISELKRLMEEYSGRLEFEKAAVIRDRIDSLERLEERGDMLDTISEVYPINPADSMAELKEILGLKDMPHCVEGMDISNIKGREAVGATVVFMDGIPYKPAYRRYRIKKEGIDDYAMIREIIRRRYKGNLADMPIPDIMLIDGGLGHLNKACDTVKEIDIKCPAVISIAKREELIFTAYNSQPLRLEKNSNALRLLMYVRDEAHRFAQHYHHILRKKSVMGGLK